MRRNHWISAIALTAGLLASFGVVSSRPEGHRLRSGTPEATARTPMRYTLQLLRIAAEPLAYLPVMEQAVAATLPTILADGSLLEEAEVTLTRLGPLRIGMTVEEGADALGLPLVPLGANAGGDCAYYQPNVRNAAIGLMVVDNRIIRIDLWEGSPITTASGLKIGSTEAEVLELYPNQIEITPNPYTEGHVLTFTPVDADLKLYRFVFETDGSGKVIQYRAGQFPAVTWPDGCA
ncbi:hypothetical protein [Leptolyngbya sp. PCC 6406]|uniref:hypothetical protein n=1 Tax=Leptolyngbya sp. PCC 6406 TaxID=1173264 RepID=UPI0002AC6439|nr:hypothetical protein [Leptolyngbya sp. PCC 6406]